MRSIYYEPLFPLEANEAEYQTCPNCGSEKQLRYCPECGQRRMVDFTMASIMKEAAGMIWGADSRLIRTFRDYVNPGIYTRNWLDKKQARYISPVKMFLIINLVYFLILSVLSRYGMNFDTFVTSFESQMENQIYSGIIRDVSPGIISSAGFEKEMFADLYNNRVFAVSNSLILILSLLIAGVHYLVNFSKSRLAYHHVTMGLYYGGYILLLFIALNLFLSVLVPVLQIFVNFNFSNRFLDAGILTLCVMFSFVAQTRMYEERIPVSLFKSVVVTFLIAFAGIILYRFILFWITMANVLVFS